MSEFMRILKAATPSFQEANRTYPKSLLNAQSIGELPNKVRAALTSVFEGVGSSAWNVQTSPEEFPDEVVKMVKSDEALKARGLSGDEMAWIRKLSDAQVQTLASEWHKLTFPA